MSKNPLVAIIMGSQSDWPTMKHAAAALDEHSIPYDVKLISAHRTPDRLFDFGKTAESYGYKVIVAGTGYAAHLPGMTASLTTLPVIGVPIESKSLKGLDSLLSIVQMPKGVPVATVAIGESGARNAGILASQILGLTNSDIKMVVESQREKLTDGVSQEINLDE